MKNKEGLEVKEVRKTGGGRDGRRVSVKGRKGGRGRGTRLSSVQWRSDSLLVGWYSSLKGQRGNLAVVKTVVLETDE